MRLFVAIELPEEAQRFLDKVSERLRRPEDQASAVKWVRRENRHLTLKFIGEMRDARVPELQRALAGVRVERVRLEFERMLYLPKRGPVHVVAVECAPDGERLEQLYRDLEDVGAEFDIARERRGFTPHVTIGRSRGGERGSGLRALRQIRLDELFPGPSFEVAQVCLIRSNLIAAGPEYHVLGRVPPDPNIY